MATGTSVLGRQVLLDTGPWGANVFMSLDAWSDDSARYTAFVSLELQFGSDWYQFEGRSLWYQGVWFQQPYSSFFPIRLVAEWRIAGLDWTAGTA